MELDITLTYHDLLCQSPSL